MKGVILAGGLGTRLMPLTLVSSKHVLPIYDQPMIYYPIRTLLNAGIDEMLIVTGGEHAGDFLRLLRNGKHLGIKHLEYTFQEGEGGVADALRLAEEFADGERICVILGDNIIQGNVAREAQEFARQPSGAKVLLKRVPDPERFGVARLEGGRIVGIVEKPADPPSPMIVTGIYFYDADVFAITRTLRPSGRGELEITDVNSAYMARGALQVEIMGRGYAWLDTGTHDSLLEASIFVQILEQRQGLRISSPEEIAFRRGFITREQLLQQAQAQAKSAYGQYLMEIASRQSVLA